MLAYKTKLNIDTGHLHLQLPVGFKGKQVEVIILEVDDFSVSDEPKITVMENVENVKSSESLEEPNEFQRFLLTAPTWSDKEYKNILNISIESKI